jgi:hypothetical protein
MAQVLNECVHMLSRAVASLDTGQGQLACGGEAWPSNDELKKIVPAELRRHHRFNNAGQLSTTLIDVRGARRSSGTSIKKRLPSGLDSGVLSTPVLGGKGSRCGTPLSKALPVEFTGAAKKFPPVLKTISRSVRHCGQLPPSFEICHLPSPNDGWSVGPDARNGRTYTSPLPVAIDM